MNYKIVIYDLLRYKVLPVNLSDYHALLKRYAFPTLEHVHKREESEVNK